MKLAAASVVVLLAALPALAQDGDVGSTEIRTGPPLTLLVHHPHPDDADPFGFPYPDGSPVGPFAWRYGHLDSDRDGFDFPSMVVDGRLLAEGLPDPSRPYAGTRTAYAELYQERAGEETPIGMVLESVFEDGGLRIQVDITSSQSMDTESARLWIAVSEDPVHYVPPAALSNGVYDHRFTTRHMAAGALLNGTGPWQQSFQVPLDDDWQTERLRVAAWLQQTAVAGNIFAAHEVVQATSAAAGDRITARDKGVLMELYSATWCDPCLFGDRAAEDLAVAVGAAEPVEIEKKSTRYLETPDNPWLVAPAIAVGAWLLGRRWRRLP